MKPVRLITLTVAACIAASYVSAQTAEEIIDKYLNAIGGKNQIATLNSMYSEGTIDAMGNQGSVKMTTLNGKGYKQEIDVMGTVVVMCYTDTMGWQINPMGGNYSPEKMSEIQYLASRDQIYIGGPFISDYKSKGYKTELVGQEMAGEVNAFKIKVMTPQNVESDYYFDPETGYLIKMVQKAEMMGQPMDVTISMSKYEKPENGFAMPYTMEINYGGQFFLVMNIKKVEFNQPVDPTIFAMPL